MLSFYHYLALLFGSFAIGYSITYTIRSSQAAVRLIGYSIIAFTATFLIAVAVNAGMY